MVAQQLTVGGAGDWFRAISPRTSITDASAVVCARGVYRAGCAGPHGAAWLSVTTAV